MYDSILVPTDASEGSELASEAAIELATRFDATLHALYVVETGDVSYDAPAADIYDEVQARGLQALDDVAKRAEAAGVGTVETVLGEGHPHRAILDYVDEYDVDLVVVGTHGRTGPERYLLGSVTEKVVRLSDVPVLTVPRPTG